MAVDCCLSIRIAKVLVPRSNRKESNGVKAFPIALTVNASCYGRGEPKI